MAEHLSLESIGPRKAETALSGEYNVLGVKLAPSILFDEHAIGDMRTDSQVEVIVADKILCGCDGDSPRHPNRVSVAGIRIYEISGKSEWACFPGRRELA